jgi:hypothetical protein
MKQAKDKAIISLVVVCGQVMFKLRHLNEAELDI